MDKYAQQQPPVVRALYNVRSYIDISTRWVSLNDPTKNDVLDGNLREVFRKEARAVQRICTTMRHRDPDLNNVGVPGRDDVYREKSLHRHETSYRFLMKAQLLVTAQMKGILHETDYANVTSGQREKFLLMQHHLQRIYHVLLEIQDMSLHYLAIHNTYAPHPLIDPGNP